MARQNKSGKGTESTETVTPDTEAPATEAATTEEAPIDLTAFQTAAQTVVEQADKSTGELTAEQVEPANVEYRNLDGQKAKIAARNWLEEQMLAAVGDLNPQLARSYNDLRSNLKAGGGSSTPRQPADPTAAFVQQVASLQIAYGLRTSDVPENVSEDWAAQVEKLVGELAGDVTAYGEWVKAEVPEGEEKPDAPTVSPVVRNAYKLASGKASGGRGGSAGGPRRDIGKHIAEAFAGADSGTFMSVAEIAKFKSTEYGEDSPSQGAISARLFPESGKLTVEGITAVGKGDHDGKNPKGAVKA